MRNLWTSTWFGVPLVVVGHDRHYEPISTGLLLTMLAGSAASAAGQSIAGGKANKKAQQIADAQIAANKIAQDQDVALKESMLDPFRQQMHQARDIGRLDMMEHASYSPTVMSGLPPRYAGNVPQMSGGFNYTKSPDVGASAGMLKRNVMGGNVAPTMTNPANLGKTSALDLLTIAGSGVDPGHVNAANTAPRNPASYTTGAPTRGGGGARATDVTVSTATQIVANAIRQELGREPMAGEIEQMLAGQGLKPGDRFVGSAGLNGVIASLRQNAGPQPSYTGLG